MVEGRTLVARSLKSHGLQHCFGIVGIPVIELGYSIQEVGIKYYGFRNEQAASYAAGAVGYLEGKPGICLSVPGPGMTNCISGLANAQVNKWPMILISGSSNSDLDGFGSFQECPQIEAARPFVKYAARPSQAARIPYIIQQAVRVSMYSVAGPVYVDLPGNLLTQKIDEADVFFPMPVEMPAPVIHPSQQSVFKAYQLLKSAQKPLVIVGKGCGMSPKLLQDNCKELRGFVVNANLPVLPTPMGKGYVSDESPNIVSAARSLALKQADVILLLGARLNWILHFGLPPRFNKAGKVIQVDYDAKELHTNRKSHCAVLSDLGVFIQMLNHLQSKDNWKFNNSKWWMSLREKQSKNEAATKRMIEDSSPEKLNYYTALSAIQTNLPKDSIIISEGANTMDIGRTILKNNLPKHRLDAATFGTMGIGSAFAIAAKAVCPKKRVVLVSGDSAFGFSAMQIQTAMRYKLPFVVLILNNNGIYQGVEELEEDRKNEDILPTALTPNLHYEKIAEAFGGKSYLVRSTKELEKCLKDVFSHDKIAVVNVLIDPFGMKKPQEFSWLTQKAKL